MNTPPPPFQFPTEQNKTFEIFKSTLNIMVGKIDSLVGKENIRFTTYSKPTPLDTDKNITKLFHNFIKYYDALLEKPVLVEAIFEWLSFIARTESGRPSKICQFKDRDEFERYCLFFCSTDNFEYTEAEKPDTVYTRIQTMCRAMKKGIIMILLESEG